ncbi:DUF4352 domain-containing protein [Candidatus Woesearchaeota archaeon]|nr:DUF4352 domain-containing protein [Candidatus Woesearchaeota archaeon]
MVEEKTKKPWYKRWWVITLFVIVGLVILVNLLGTDKGSTQTNNLQKASTQEQITSNQPEAKTYSLGDEIQAGDFKWKITKSSTAKEIGQDVGGTFFGEKADGIFIILDVDIENTGKTAQYLTDSFIKLVDDQGREFSPNTAAAIYIKPQGSALIFEQINPGIKKKGKIVYDVPEGLRVANVRISSNLLESSVYNVKLII